MATTTVPTTCQPIQTQLQGLQQQLDALENEVGDGAGPEHAAARQIQSLHLRIAFEQTQLEACIAKNGGGSLPVGAIVRDTGDNTVYLIGENVRHAFPDMHTLAIQYPHPSIVAVSAQSLSDFPIGDPIPQVRRFIADTGNTNLGANHWMHTVMGLEFATGSVVGRTRVATETWFGGFHGGVLVTLLDSDSLAVGGGRYDFHQQWGVDGTKIGQNVRYGDWHFSVDLADVPKICSIEIFQSWNSDNVLQKIKDWESTLLPIAQLFVRTPNLPAATTPAKPDTAPTKPPLPKLEAPETNNS